MGGTMTSPGDRKLRLLFVCTENSARSQIAEALLGVRRGSRLEVGSAGTAPAAAVHEHALAVLERRGIDWSRARPKSLDAVAGEPWDIVVTVCDRAREACPAVPGRPVTVHWGIPDPAAVEGDEAARLKAFDEAALMLGHRIDLLLALPLEKLEKIALEQALQDIAKSTPIPPKD